MDAGNERLLFPSRVGKLVAPFVLLALAFCMSRVPSLLEVVVGVVGAVPDRGHVFVTVRFDGHFPPAALSGLRAPAPAHFLRTRRCFIRAFIIARVRRFSLCDGESHRGLVQDREVILRVTARARAGRFLPQRRYSAPLSPSGQ